MSLTRRIFMATVAALPVVSGLARAQTVRPNIVMVLTDDQPKHFNPAAMPKLLARTDIITCSNALSQVGLCCPSRATLFSGQYDVHNGVIDNQKGKFFGETNTLATRLKAAGYRTALVGKYLNGYPFGRGNYVPAGWDEWHGLSGDHPYYGYKMVETADAATIPTVLNSYLGSGTTAPQNYSTTVIMEKSVAIVNAHDYAARPLFLWVSTRAPHYPATPENQYKTTFTANHDATHDPDFNVVGANAPTWQQALPALDPHSQDVQQVSVWNCLLSIDDGIDAIIAALTAQGQLDNTVICIMSDNGIALGAHRWKEKRYEYREANDLPMWWRMPGGASFTIPALVGNNDIASTFAELAGTSMTLAQDGVSMAPWLHGLTPTWRDSFLQHWRGGNDGGAYTGALSCPEFWSLRTATDVLIWLNDPTFPDQEYEYYDLASDAFQMVNAISDPTKAARIAVMKVQLAAAIP